MSQPQASPDSRRPRPTSYCDQCDDWHPLFAHKRPQDAAKRTRWVRKVRQRWRTIVRALRVFYRN